MGSQTPCTVMFALILTLPALSAQRTWIVDAANGTGTDFTQLPAAISAAKDGDIVLVRKGTYSGQISTSKAISLLGEPGATMTSDSWLWITNIPKGRRFVVKGFVIQALVLKDNKGRVHLEGLVLNTTALIENCAGATLNDCRVAGGLVVRQSKVVVSRGMYRGFNAGSSGRDPVYSTPGLQAVSSEVMVSEVQVTGGNGATHLLTVPLLPSPAVLVDASALTVAGSSTLTAGVFTGFPAWALQGSNRSRLTLDSNATVTSSGGAKAHTGFTAVSVRGLPALSVTGAGLGGTVTVQLRSPQGDSFVLALGLPTEPQPVPPLGDLWLAPGSLTVLAAGIQGSTGTFQLGAKAPATPSLRGLDFGLQALDGTSALIELSNPAVSILH